MTFIRKLFSSPPPPSPPPAPPPEFDKPWRDMKWRDKSDLEHKLRNFNLNHPDVPFVRILLVGEVGAGKSSFINSINNVFQKRITCEALTDACTGTSFTKTYTTHYIEGNDGSLLSFGFNDIMGIEEGSGGITPNDLINALDGILQEGYNCDPTPSGSNTDPRYRTNPSLKDQAHCVVNIIDGAKVSIMKQGIIEKMKIVREKASKLGLPQVIIMTKPDETCPLVKKDLKKIYTSKKIKEKMEVCRNLLGIPVNFIFPVKNYHEEMDTNDEMDALILKALDQIVNIACDAVKKKKTNSGDKAE